MTINVSYDVRTADGTTPLARTRALPTLPDAKIWHRPFVDRIGAVMSSDKPALGITGMVGAVAGAALTRKVGGGIFKSIGGGIGGALLGAAATIGIGMILHRNDDQKPAQPADQVAPSVTISGTEQVKVMTYNLHGGMGGPGQMGSNSTELDKLADTIRAENPDVLIVQESDTGAVRSSFKDTLSELSKRLGPTSAVEASPETYAYGRQQYSGVVTFHGFQVDNARQMMHADYQGSGILRRIEGTMDDGRKLLNETLHTKIGKPGTTTYTPRATIDTIVRTPGGNDIRVAGGHYNPITDGYDYPVHSSVEAAQALGSWHGATLFGGDFNVSSNTVDGKKLTEAFASSGMTDAFTAAGIPAGDPLRRSLINSNGDIDRVYASNQFHVSDVHVVHEAGAPASDHRPVVATYTLRDS